MEMSPEERLRIVREAQQKKEIVLSGNTPPQVKETNKSYTEAIMAEVNALLNELALFGPDAPSQKITEEYKKYLSDCIYKYLKAEHRVSQKMDDLLNFHRLPQEQKVALLQQLIADFNTINGLLDSPRAADAARVHPPETFIDIMSDSHISDELKQPEMVRFAITSQITDPKGKILSVEENIHAIQDDPNIPEEYKLPWLIHLIAKVHTTDAVETLKDIIATVKKLRKDPEIPDECKDLSLLLSIASNNTSDPKKALLRIADHTTAIETNTTIPQKWKKPSFIKYVVKSYRENPLQAMKRMIAHVRELQKDPEIPDEYKNFWILQRIVSRHIDNPKPAITRSIELCHVLEKDNTIPLAIRQNKQLLITATIIAPNKAKAFLKNTAQRIVHKRIDQSDEGYEFEDIDE